MCQFVGDDIADEFDRASSERAFEHDAAGRRFSAGQAYGDMGPGEAGLVIK